MGSVIYKGVRFKIMFYNDCVSHPEADKTLTDGRFSYQAFLEHSYKLFTGIIQDFRPLPITNGLFEVLNVHDCYPTYCNCVVCMYICSWAIRLLP